MAVLFNEYTNKSSRMFIENIYRRTFYCLVLAYQTMLLARLNVIHATITIEITPQIHKICLLGLLKLDSPDTLIYL